MKSPFLASPGYAGTMCQISEHISGVGKGKLNSAEREKEQFCVGIHERNRKGG
jgi:hypothetical protein